MSLNLDNIYSGNSYKKYSVSVDRLSTATWRQLGITLTVLCFY